MRSTLLLLLTVSLTFAGEWTRSYQLGNSPDIEVRCDDGTLDFTAGPAGRLNARVVTQGWEIRPGEVEVIESHAGDRVRLHVKVPRHRHWNSGNRSVRVEIVVPPEAKLFGNTGDGRIRAVGIGGDLRFETGDGVIHAEDVHGNLEARTGDGAVTALGRFAALRIHTGDGSVDVNARPGSKVASSWSVETGDGSVHLRVPDDVKADLDARTGDGSLNLNVPGLNATGSGDHETRGRLNGGGYPLRVRTGDGSITISASR